MAYRKPSPERADEAKAERARQLAAEIQELDAALGQLASRAVDGAAAPPEAAAMMARHEQRSRELRELTDTFNVESGARWKVRGLALLAVAFGVAGLAAASAFCLNQKPSERSVARDRESAERIALLQTLTEDRNAQTAAIASAQAEATSARTDAERATAELKLAAAQEQQRRLQAQIDGLNAQRPPALGPALAPGLRR